jgi:hypothetical protein
VVSGEVFNPRILTRLRFRNRAEVAALVAEVGAHRQDPDAEQAS